WIFLAFRGGHCSCWFTDSAMITNCSVVATAETQYRRLSSLRINISIRVKTTNFAPDGASMVQDGRPQIPACRLSHIEIEVSYRRCVATSGRCAPSTDLARQLHHN